MLSVILNERESLNKKMDVFINMRMNNELSKDVFAEKYRPMEERLIQLNNQLPELQAEIDFLKIQHRSSDVVLSDATDLYTHWDSLDLDAKRTIVETITDKITVGKEDIHIKMSYLPTKQAQTAEPTQSKNDPHNSNQNPVKRQSNLIRTLPFSHVDISIPVRPKGYTENPKTIGEHLIRSWAYPMYFLPNWKTYSTSGQRCVSQTAK